MSLKPVPAVKVVKVLSKAGFRQVRQRGSHLIMEHDDGRIIVIPIHKGEEIGRGLPSRIINEAGLSREEFLKLLEEI